MKASELIEHIRNDVIRDSAKPYLCSDSLLLLFLNEVYARFCRETGMYHASAAFDVTLLSGEDTYDVPENVVHIKRIIIPSEQRTVTSIPAVMLPPPGSGATGLPVYFALDETWQRFRVFPAPDKDYDASLVCLAAYPELSEDSDLLIPPQYQRELANGVAYLCLSQVDNDLYDPKMAAQYKEMFETFLVRSKRDVFRLNNPNPVFIRPNWTGKRG